MSPDELHALEQAVAYLHLPWRCGKNHWDVDAIYDANGCAVSERVSESDDTVTAVNAIHRLIAEARAAYALADHVRAAHEEFLASDCVAHHDGCVGPDCHGESLGTELERALSLFDAAVGSLEREP